MAEVHLAVQRGPAGFEKLAVIKVVHEHLASQASFVEMLLDEARHAALIRHPNVVEIYDLGEEAGRHFIAMEYLEGEPLLEVLRVAGEGGARLDPLSIARVIADTAEGSMRRTGSGRATAGRSSWSTTTSRSATSSCSTAGS